MTPEGIGTAIITSFSRVAPVQGCPGVSGERVFLCKPGATLEKPNSLDKVYPINQ